MKKCFKTKNDRILFFTDLVYEKLVSLIVGSYYVTVTLYQNNVVKSSSQVIAQTTKDLGHLNDFQNKTCIDIFCGRVKTCLLGDRLECSKRPMRK